MPSLRIDVFEDGQDEPKTRIRVPLRVARLALRFVPTHVLDDLGLQGADIARFLDAVQEEGLSGTLAEIERRPKRTLVYVE